MKIAVTGAFSYSGKYIARRLLARGELAAFEVTRRFYEIGSHEGLEEARNYLSGKEAKG